VQCETCDLTGVAGQYCAQTCDDADRETRAAVRAASRAAAARRLGPSICGGADDD